MSVRMGSRRSTWAFLFMMALGVATIGLAHAAIVERPMDLEAAKVRNMLLEDKFADLEAYEMRTRDLSLTMSDGQQLHAAFYQAVTCGCAGVEDIDKERAHVAAWRTAYPDSPSAQIAEAGLYMQAAWFARGQEYAYKVKESAWPIFRSNVSDAARVLDAMGKSAREQPDWYALRLTVMRLQDADKAQYSDLLDEALARFPLYLPIYFEGVQYYQGKWHGSDAEYRDFIDRAVSLTRDRWGDTMYARLEWVTWDNQMFRSGQADWRRMKAAFERLISDYPDGWNVNAFGNFACIALDPQTTLQVLSKIEGAVAPSIWGLDFYTKCKSWAIRKAGGDAQLSH